MNNNGSGWNYFGRGVATAKSRATADELSKLAGDAVMGAHYRWDEDCFAAPSEGCDRVQEKLILDAVAKAGLTK